MAEGVETIDHADMCAGLGCHIGQGYFFSRPLPKDDFEFYLSEHKGRHIESSARQEAKLRVGLPTFGAINKFQETAMEFRADHPEFEVEIHCDVSDYLFESLNLGELDLIVAVTTGPIDIDPQHAWLDHHSTPSLLLPSPQHALTLASLTTARPHSYFPHHSTPSLLLPSPQHALTLTSLTTT